jgi:GntR family transcriptional regulator
LASKLLNLCAVLVIMQTEASVGVVAIHDQIADAIRARITSGELAPGDPIPTIEQLRTQWHCAAGPVRTALSILRNEGLISGGRGKPAVVRQPPHRIRLPLGWSQQMKDNVLQPKDKRATVGAIELTVGTQLTEANFECHFEEVAADDDLAAEFSLPIGTTLIRRTYELAHKQTGLRIEYSVSYIPKKLIEGNPDLLDECKEPWPGGHLHQLYTVGIEVDRFVRTLIAVQPTPGTRQKWGMEPGVPLLRVRSRSIDILDRVVEVSDATYPADRVEIEFTEQLARWPEDHPEYVRNGQRA